MMFKKAKRKIVITVLSILCSVLVGTLGMIYLASFLSVTSQNYETLERHIEMFSSPKAGEPQDTAGKTKKDGMGRMDGMDKAPERMERKLKIGTFYTVKFTDDGETAVIENDEDSVYTDSELINIANDVKNNEKGRTGELLYIVTANGNERIVSFMDNTVFTDSFSRLFRFTLLFGVIAIIIITFISVYIAGRIVSPMEETYKKQKQFTADAGHELKTPIAAVSANAEMLRREIGENKWLSNIEFENGRMKTLVTELLELARNENKTADRKPTDLSHLAVGTILPLEASAFEKGVMIESNIEDGIIANIDESSIGQLITILVDNAISHTSAKDGEMATVKVNLSLIKGNAVLSVSNPGKEIPKDSRDKIFERFYRADSSREFTGHYGLGLAIAKSIADLNGAKISVSCYDGLVCFNVIFRHN